MLITTSNIHIVKDRLTFASFYADSVFYLILFYLKTITSELHKYKSMHFSQVTVIYIGGGGNWNLELELHFLL